MTPTQRRAKDRLISLLEQSRDALRKELDRVEADLVQLKADDEPVQRVEVRSGDHIGGFDESAHVD